MAKTSEEITEELKHERPKIEPLDPHLPQWLVEVGEDGKQTIRRIDDPIKVSVSAEQTVNLGNYESAKIFFSLSNIPHGATEEQIEAALETGEVAFNYVRTVISERVETMRRNMAARL